MGGLHPAARIQRLEVFPYHVLEGDELLASQGDEPAETLRRLHAGEVLGAAPRIVHDHRETDAGAGQHRKRMTGRPRDGLWGERGEHAIGEIAPHRVPLHVAQFRPPQHADAFPGQRRSAGLYPAPLLPLDQRAEPQRDRFQLPPGRQPVVAALGGTGCGRAGERPHAHHEELVQVRAEDREKAHARQQRYLGIFGQLEHPRVERDRGQVFVEQVIRCRFRGIARQRCDFGDVDESPQRRRRSR